MPREKADYRNNLEELKSYFGNKRLLTVKDVAGFTGRTVRYAKKVYGIDPKAGIMITVLARLMCEG